MTWEKDQAPSKRLALRTSTSRWKFMVGGLLILASIGYLMVSGTLTNAQYFITVDELVEAPEQFMGDPVRISGAVIGPTIEYDSEALDIRFTISHIPTEFDNLAQALHQSVNNPENTRLEVFISDEVKPDLLRHEAQAILTGTLGTDGVFYATELLLKCPSRFEDGGSGDNLEEDHPGMQLIESNAG